MLAFASLVYVVLFAQHRASPSGYMQTQYFINPAYSATSNTMAVNLMARKQWWGIEGAPTSYRLAAYSPINNTLMSVGGALSLEEYGVYKAYMAIISYAYLLKISPVTFLSLGINTNVHSHQIAFNELKLVNNNDPYFSNASESETQVNMASGAFLYSRKFYLGFSVSNLLEATKVLRSYEPDQMHQKRQFYMTMGYTFRPNQEIGIRPSFLSQYQKQDAYSLTGGVQLIYKDLFWVGAAYSKGGWMGSLINLKVQKDFWIAYAFDFAVGNNLINRSNHEIAISCNIYAFYKKNKKRAFGKRKIKKDKHKESMKSLRNF
ncbi:type IX secretion system membrane protein, PorP/SprF family [Saccharicrinis carchari]|uniref:Type IX secretion system membrane protein, PorP/SprF family n=1 Tax=Saccharicrinis carchari TaxID=1168039 RepID=A0A521BZA6_SACCC|nr:type IX secretion system membrane protein PorP/SprF [Saccharicrinis carchari]SMO51800.1 type IX secretion system membrane protein, PorP/SprF family [Saccharicrinis carchari]